MIRTIEKVFRTDEAAAALVLSQLIPKESKQALSKVFANSCRHAHIQSPTCWELTLNPSFLRLNVGQVALLSIANGELFLCVTRLPGRISRRIRVDRSKGPPINSFKNVTLEGLTMLN